MRAAVPLIEIPHHAHALRGRRPDREVHAGGGADGQAVRAELLEGAMMRPLAEQVEVVFRQHPAVAIRVVHLERRPAVRRDLQAIVGNVGTLGKLDLHLEQPLGTQPSHRLDQAGRHDPQIDPGGIRPHGSNDHTAGGGGMWAEERKRIGVLPVGERGEPRVESGVRHGAGY